MRSNRAEIVIAINKAPRGSGAHAQAMDISWPWAGLLGSGQCKVLTSLRS